MTEFKGGEWFRITGRGDVYASRVHPRVEGGLVGRTVLIEGSEYVVRGVEAFAILRGEPPVYAENEPMGILVSGPRRCSHVWDNVDSNTVQCAKCGEFQ